jgi:hypothetical protein
MSLNNGHPMKRSFVLPVALLALVALGAGCAHTYRASTRTGGPLVQRPRSFALAVTVAGGLQPTPAQWAAIRAKLAAEFAARGWVLVTDLDLADHIVRVHYIPSVDDPENTGRATIVGVRNNPRSMVARRGMSPYPSSVGYASFNSSSWMYGSRYSSGYYGYSDYYNEGFSYNVPVTPVVNKPSPPPYRHPPGQRDDCPPSLFIRPLPTRGDVASNPINDHPRPPPRDLGRFRSDRTAYSQIDIAAFQRQVAESSGSGSRSYSRASSYARAETGTNNSDFRSSSSNYSRPEVNYTYSDQSYSRSEPVSTPTYSRAESASYSAPETTPSTVSAPAPEVTYSAPAASP